MKTHSVFLLGLFTALCALGVDNNNNINTTDPTQVDVVDVTIVPQPDKILIYKKVAEKKVSELPMHIFYPQGKKPDSPLPTVVFFSGGAWNKSDMNQFALTAQILADLGMVAVLADYRTQNRMAKDDPIKCVEDAKSAVRYLREHAEDLGINPDMIAAAGGSAGGHIASASALVTKFDAPDENLEVSSKPNLLLLYNPVMDNSPGNFGCRRVSHVFPDISPFHQLNKEVPPSIVVVGSEDTTCKASMCERYKAYLDENKIDCELYIYPGEGHSFFNTNKGKKNCVDVINKVVAFLRKHKYLP